MMFKICYSSLALATSWDVVAKRDCYPPQDRGVLITKYLQATVEFTSFCDTTFFPIRQQNRVSMQDR